MAIGIISWLVIGIVAGFIASKLVNLRGDDPLVGILCATGGAVVAGILFSLISGRGVAPWDLWSMLAAAAGAAAGAAVYHVIRSRSISHGQQSVRRSY
jgi:uncharacterized membrane protein YeaQ/YmgE (transglycosylase-associated protein family)